MRVDVEEWWRKGTGRSRVTRRSRDIFRRWTVRGETETFLELLGCTGSVCRWDLQLSDRA